jgi:curved DNA-binding protein CbpA
MNPYLVLGVPLEADDQAIRQAYLIEIKQASPDSNPKRFQSLNRAYEKIKDEPSRLRYLLFDRECPAESPLDTLAKFGRHCRRLEPMSFEKLKEHLRSQAGSRVN